MNIIDYKRLSIDEFTRIASYNISVFFMKSEIFFTTNVRDISEFYSGTVNVANSQSFKFLKYLLKESDKINSLFSQNRDQFDKFYFWELLDNFSDLRTNLQVIDNLSKYLRSSRTKDSYLSSPEVNYTTRSYDTLEKIQDNINSSDFDNQWQNIAMRNDLREEDYNINGGKNIKLPLNFNAIFLDSVIDNLEGEKMYGVDFDKKITFIDDDLKILTYKETVIQSLNILINLQKGDIPSTPNLGLDPSISVGSTLANFRLPSITRQMNEAFSADDTFTGFRIKKLKNEADGMFIEYEVNTVLGESIPGSVKF